MFRTRQFTMIFCLSLIVCLWFTADGFIRAEPPETEIERCEEEGLEGAGPPEVWARVGDLPITREEVERPIQPQVTEAVRKLYDVRRQMLDRLIAQRLLELAAREKNVTVEKLIEDEIKSKVSPVTDDDVKGFVIAQKKGERTVQAAGEEAIRNRLYNQRYYQTFYSYIQKLREEFPVDIYLEEPSIPVRKVATLDDPWTGPRMAAVTIVEFIDFECGGCARVHEVLNRIVEAYEGKVKLIARDYPIARHQFSQKAAVAAACAHEQGTYWEFADMLFHNQDSLDPESLKSYARTLDLNMDQFNECFDSGAPAEETIEDRNDGIQAGVVSTPTVFVNGIQAPDLSERTIRSMVARELRAKGLGSTARR